MGAFMCSLVTVISEGSGLRYSVPPLRKEVSCTLLSSARKSCGKAQLADSFSGKVIWVQEGMESQRGSALNSSEKSLSSYRISTGHQNIRPTRVSSKRLVLSDSYSQKVREGWGEWGKEKEEKKVLLLFQFIFFWKEWCDWWVFMV